MYIYLIIINIFSFILYGLDKYKAIHNMWRIPEIVLISISFIGGGIGSILGMIIFRHKTKKLSFKILNTLSLLIFIYIIKNMSSWLFFYWQGCLYFTIIL